MKTISKSRVTNINFLLTTSIHNQEERLSDGMTNRMIMKWKCFVRLSNFPTNSVRKCIEIIREKLWMWILGLTKWVKLHIELNSPWHCFFAPRMGIKAVLFIELFHWSTLHSSLTAGLIWRWWCECNWLLRYDKIGDIKNEQLHFDNIAAKRVEKRNLRDERLRNCKPVLQ